MKTLNLTFTDKKFREMKKIKNKSPHIWEEFIYKCIKLAEELKE